MNHKIATGPQETLARLEKKFKNHPHKRFKIGFYAMQQREYWTKVQELNAKKQNHE